MKILNYDNKVYRFREAIQSIIQVEDLYKLHELYYDEGFLKENYVNENGKSLQGTVFHKRYYSDCEPFLAIYKEYVTQFIAPFWDEDILIQKIPTFRIHAVDSRALGGGDDLTVGPIQGVHKDSDFNHSKHEVNFFLPFTDVNEYNTIWYKEGKSFAPMMVNYGQIYQWNGSTIPHGNKVNTSNQTRVSVDFRILPRSKYVETSLESYTNNKRFIIGEYFEEL